MSSIIHFTGEYDNLKSILSERAFRLKYCREVFYMDKSIVSSAVHPMVSFSEQSLKSLHKKKITYGKFGIAMKKAWVSAKKLHPVLYLDGNSTVANALALLLKARRKNANTQLAPQVRLSIMTIKCFIKNASGYNSYFRQNNFDFKSEKEWRYVPTKTDISNNLISQTKSRYENRPNYYNDKLEKFPLRFRSSDIEYLFVETEKQRTEISETFKIDKRIILLSKWGLE